MNIYLVIQPPNSTCCAQACCAMLTYMSLDNVCKEFGHSHASYTRETIRFLRNHGYSCPNRLQPLRGREPPCDLCILKLRRDGFSMGHFAVYYDGFVYDPANGKTLLHHYINGVRATSYLPLTKTLA